MKQLIEYLNENFFGNLGIGKVAKIEEWLKKYNIKNYTINDDLTIDVYGGVNLASYAEKQLPEYIQFNEVTGPFNLSYSKLTSLKGCPIKCNNNFTCWGSKNLTSLVGGPIEVKGYYEITCCTKIKSLIGCPKEVGGSFYCGECGVEFTEDDVKKVSNVKGKIYAK